MWYGLSIVVGDACQRLCYVLIWFLSSNRILELLHEILLRLQL